MARKKSTYELKDLISDYNIELYHEVAKTIPIHFSKSKDGWSAKIKDNIALITYKESRYPDACFAHELLHIKYELNGLLPPKVIDNENITSLLPILFNQLCHHKFYNEFRSLGFTDEEFLNELDFLQIDYLARRDIKILEEFHSKNGEIPRSTLILMPYIMLKSPHDKSENTEKFIKRISQVANRDFLLDIDMIFKDWAENPSLDSSMTFARIFKACEKPNVGFCISGEDKDIVIAGRI